MLWLHGQERTASVRYGSEEGNLLGRVATEFLPVQDRELESFFRNNRVAGDLLSWNKFVHMPIVESGGRWLPVLTFEYDFGAARVRLRVGLFQLVEDDNGQAKLRAIGFRFETPEDENGAAEQEPGRHGFHHAQPIMSFVPGDERRVLPTPQWLPTKQPSFPLDANDYIQLFLSMLVTIYGRRWLSDLRGTGFFSMLRPYVAGMHCLAGGPLIENGA